MNADAVAALLDEGVEAFRLTREYVGEDLLPAQPGWSWFDWCEKAEAALAAAPLGAAERRTRMKLCRRRSGAAEAEECGLPYGHPPPHHPRAMVTAAAGDALRAAIAEASPLANPRLSEVDWDAVANVLAGAPADELLWADVVKFVRWSANVRNDTAAAIDVARRLLGRIEASGSHQGTPSGSARVSEPRP